jgi:hypothetical protein
VAFITMATGQFLIFPNWITLIYAVAAAGLICRQVLREEAFCAGITVGPTRIIATRSDGISESDGL